MYATRYILLLFFFFLSLLLRCRWVLEFVTRRTKRTHTEGSRQCAYFPPLSLIQPRNPRAKQTIYRFRCHDFNYTTTLPSSMLQSIFVSISNLFCNIRSILYSYCGHSTIAFGQEGKKVIFALEGFSFYRINPYKCQLWSRTQISTKFLAYFGFETGHLSLRTVGSPGNKFSNFLVDSGQPPSGTAPQRKT